MGRRFFRDIVGTVALTGLTPKDSRFAGKTILQEHIYTFADGNGELLAKVKEWHLRTERDTARRRGKHKRLEPASYSPEEIERIFQDCEKEEVRGSKPRFWEDTLIGDKLAPVVKGPLRVTDNVAWKVGWGFRPFAYAHKLGVDYYRRHPMAFIPNDQGVPDVPERVHWDEDFARRVGVPTSYDFGPQRVAWLAQVVTNWMGDDGFIVSFRGEVRRFNLVGDTHWLQGEVTGKSEREGRRFVTVALSGVDQRGEETIRGGAEVTLPSREGSSGVFDDAARESEVRVKSLREGRGWNKWAPAGRPSDSRPLPTGGSVVRAAACGPGRGGG